MMDAAVRDLIACLHEKGQQYVLALTGGGAAAAGWLLSVPGGSRTVLEVVIPYGARALQEFLGKTPESYCSAQTARNMAERAWQRASWLAPGKATAGVGCTASLASDRPKRGEHRFYLSVHTCERRLTFSLTLSKGQRDREGEETVVDLVLLNAMAEGFGIGERVGVTLLDGEEIKVKVEPTDLVAELVAGRIAAFCQEKDGLQHTGGPLPSLLLPGSFNPLHEGHCILAAVSSQIEGRPATFEITAINADKPPLAAAEIRRRLEQFIWQAPVWLTRAPTFEEKASLFPGAVFVVGADTAERIVQPRFYQSSEVQMAEALGALRAKGCRFLVAGRVDSAGVFRGVEDLVIPPEWRDLFKGIPAELFRMDVSSTQLRECSVGGGFAQPVEE
jgi:nicotinamide mononucleotide (NMN) deamidase PncC